jgi:site-specific recombinase XerD
LALSKLFSKARKCHWYLERVAALMGHTSLETTRIYTTPTEQDLTKAVEKLAD